MLVDCGKVMASSKCEGIGEGVVGADGGGSNGGGGNCCRTAATADDDDAEDDGGSTNGGRSWFAGCAKVGGIAPGIWGGG